jgi:hypothetical protein
MTTPVALPGEWTFYADAAVPPYTPMGPVALTSFTCQWALSDFGSGEAVIPVDRGGLTRSDLLGFFRWRLWAFYENVPVWAGLSTGLTDDGGAAVTVSLMELPGYLQRKTYATTNTYSQIEQTTIAGDLAARLDNIGVPRVLVPGSGVKRDRQYSYLQGNRGDLLKELAGVQNGIEFRAEYGMSGGAPTCQLRIAYPRAGGSSGLALVLPGGPVSVQAVWSSDLLRTRTFEVGDLPNNAATTAQRPVAYLEAQQVGLPELDVVTDRPGVILSSTLNEYASTDSSIYGSAALALSSTMPVSSPPLGTYAVGDDVAVQMADPLMPSGLATTGRLISASADAAAGTVAWTVAITQPPPTPVHSLARRLRLLDRNQAGAFRRSLVPPPGGINP